MNLTTYDKIIKAKIALQKEKPFWARLILSLNIQQDDKNILGDGAAASIDPNGNLLYSEKCFSSLNEDEIKYILSHEVSHMTFNHLTRISNRNPMLWNIATDLVINALLNKDGFKAPQDGLIPDRKHTYTLGNKTLIDLDKKTAEEVYDEIQDTPEQQNKGFDQHNYKELTEQEKEKIEQEWKQTTIDAANYSQLKGQQTGSFEKIIQELLNPKVNWKYLLYKYITNAIPNDYTFNKRSKKSTALGIYLPNIQKENIDIIIHIDSSGSIDQKMLTEFVTEIVSIAKSFENITMTLIECDNEIKQVLEIKNGNIDTILEIKIKGGGGTSHKPIWQHIEQNNPNCKLLISLTDGYSDITTEDQPQYDVIFTQPKQHQIPTFGMSITIE